MDIKKSVLRLQKLKDSTLMKYLAEIDLDSEIDLYDTMITHFCKGDLDDEFLISSTVLDGVSLEEKRMIMALARKYQGLCFLDENPDNWLDSVENILIYDYDFVAFRIFENYELLLRLTKSGNSAVLEQLDKFKKYDGFDNSSVIEYLKNNFLNDKVLEDVIINMSSNKDFDVFDDQQKAVLLSYPKNVLYTDFENEYVLTEPLVLANKICTSIVGEDLSALEGDNFNIFETLQFYGIEKFTDVVINIAFNDEIIKK